MQALLLRIFFSVFLVLFSAAAFAQIDTAIGCKAPKSARRNAETLAQYLTADLSTDRQKANAIYNWITHNIRYDYGAATSGKLRHDKLPRVLRKRRAVCEGYADLFTSLCKAAGLHAVTLEGYSRDWTFDDSDRLYVPRHAWNAVMIDGQWELVDATWGAGGMQQKPGWLRQQFNKAASSKGLNSGKMRFTFHYDTAYFLASPSAFRLTHLPADPVWQLTDSLMPAQVFSAGTGAVERFNKQYSLRAGDTKLQAIAATLPDILRIYEYSDRAHDYNPNFSIPLAMKGQIDAEVQLSDTLNARSPMPLDYRTGHALTALESAKTAVKAQQSGYDNEYRDLKRKNGRKNVLAKSHIRELRADNKRLITQCETKAHNAELKARKFAQLRKKDVLHLPSNNTARKTDESIIAAAQDSAAARIVRIAALEEAANANATQVEEFTGQNERRLDSMSNGLILSDSLLVQEAIARIRMRDSYDEEVIAYDRQFRQIRYYTVDSMHWRYQQAYDSVVAAYTRRQRIEATRLQLIKSSLRETGRYNSGSIASHHQILMQEYRDALAAQDHYINEYSSAAKSHASVLNALAKLYRREDKLADYMVEAEKKRQELEEKALEKKAAFNKRENEQRTGEIEKAETRVKKMSGRPSA